MNGLLDGLPEASRARILGDMQAKMMEPLAPPPIDAFRRFMVTDEQVEQMEATRKIWRDLIAQNHLQAWIGPAGAGKTAIGTFAASELAPRGFTVLYFQEDASAGDLPAMHEHAKRHGYKLLNSTLCGSSPEEQLQVLDDLIQQSADLNGYVMVFDTLKKFAFLMSKEGARSFFRLMRSLTLRGATVILLGHTNKHVGPDGKPVFEGVGDVRNDVDELFYLHASEKDEHGVKTITLSPDKVRCDVKAATFSLDTATMTVRALDRVIDVQELEKAKRQRQEDAEVIQAIDEALMSGGMNRTELIDLASASSGHGAKSVRKVLDRYLSEDAEEDGALWLLTRMRLNNVQYVSRRPGR